jgi:2,3-bisphosphoglycerate-dependent phosphoglycerate mutase
MTTLILLRHGESVWNEKNLFTGWVDVDLTPAGEAEATAGGRLINDAGIEPNILHTSVLRRAIRTANLALDSMDRLWIPVRRSWRLNERHYGNLQGLDKAETREKYGDEQLKAWRRSYDVPPPPIDADSQYGQKDDPRYPSRDVVPPSECLADVVARMMPYWYDAIIPDLAAYNTVMVTAHGNSLRALVKHLEGISDAGIAELNIPTGVPRVYQLNENYEVLKADYLGDPDEVAAKAAAVAAQTNGKG